MRKRPHYTLFLLLLWSCCFLQMTFTAAWTGSRLVPLLGHRGLATPRHSLSQQLFNRGVHLRADDGSNDHDHDAQQSHAQPQNIAIVGGGLAGLSTAFHLLDKTQTQAHNSPCRVTILDTAPVGTAGASSVAGGYVPFVLQYLQWLFLFWSSCMVVQSIHSFYSSMIIDIFATLD
jgi:hypothetical protein